MYEVKGADACELTCTGEGADSDTWYMRNANKDCDWLAGQNANKQNKLCKKSGSDGSACPVSCGACPPTAAPTPNLDDFGDFETCVDDSEWFFKKAKKNCKWVFARVFFF